MIRRACVAKLGIFSAVLDKSHVIVEIVPILKQLITNEQDSIRVHVLEALIPLASF